MTPFLALLAPSFGRATCPHSPLIGPVTPWLRPLFLMVSRKSFWAHALLSFPLKAKAQPPALPRPGHPDRLFIGVRKL